MDGAKRISLSYHDLLAVSLAKKAFQMLTGERSVLGNIDIAGSVEDDKYVYDLRLNNGPRKNYVVRCLFEYENDHIKLPLEVQISEIDFPTSRCKKWHDFVPVFSKNKSRDSIFDLKRKFSKNNTYSPAY